MGKDAPVWVGRNAPVAHANELRPEGLMMRAPAGHDGTTVPLLEICCTCGHGQDMPSDDGPTADDENVALRAALTEETQP